MILRSYLLNSTIKYDAYIFRNLNMYRSRDYTLMFKFKMSDVGHLPVNLDEISDRLKDQNTEEYSYYIVMDGHIPKVVRENLHTEKLYVAVLYSTNGAWWSTHQNNSHASDLILFSPGIVAILLQKNIGSQGQKDALSRYSRLHYQDVFMYPSATFHVEWIDTTMLFRIVPNDLCSEDELVQTRNPNEINTYGQEEIAWIKPLNNPQC